MMKRFCSQLRRVADGDAEQGGKTRLRQAEFTAEVLWQHRLFEARFGVRVLAVLDHVPPYIGFGRRVGPGTIDLATAGGGDLFHGHARDCHCARYFLFACRADKQSYALAVRATLLMAEPPGSQFPTQVGDMPAY